MKNVLWALKDILGWRQSLVWWLVVTVITAVMDSFLSVIFPAMLIARLIDAISINHLIYFVLLFCGGWTLVKAGNRYANSIIDNSDLLLTMRYGARISRATLEIPYAQWQTEPWRQREQRAKNAVENNSTDAMKLLSTLKGLAIGTLGLVVYVGSLSNLHPAVVVLLILGCLLNLKVTAVVQARNRKIRNEKLPVDKTLRYLKHLMRDFAGAHDVRIYSLAGWLNDCFGKASSKALGHEKKISKNTFISMSVDLLILMVRDGLVYVYLIYQMSRGQIGVADFVFYIGLVSTFAEWINSIAQAGNHLRAASVEWSDIREYVVIQKGQTKSNGPLATAPQELRLEDVSFAYADHSPNVLEHLSIVVHPGEKVAVVGLNGAGKSTLLKLLCGIYKPTQGKVCLGDVELLDDEIERYQDCTAAIWQNSSVLPVSIAENISCLPLEQTDMDRVNSSLKMAGLDALIHALPNGVHTPLMAQLVHDAVNLSGGEQQKLLLARAIYKNAAYLLLDEPTAMLDPIAEKQMYLQYDQIANGATVLFVSHRLASTSFCDRIILLEDGKILEQGTHEELMQNQGRYAELYHVQSQYYGGTAAC